MLIQMIVRNGGKIVMRNVEDEQGQVLNLTVAQYIYYNFLPDKLRFSKELYNRMLEECVAHAEEASFDAEAYFIHHADLEISQLATALSVDPLQLVQAPQEEPLTEEERMARMTKEEEKLLAQTNHMVLDFRMDYVERRLRTLKQEIAAATGNAEELAAKVKAYADMQIIRNRLAQKLGNYIIV